MSPIPSRSCMFPIAAFLFGSPVSAQIALVADSVVEFSGEQGRDGWHYGYYDLSGDADGVYAEGDFQPFTTDAFDGVAWRSTMPGQPTTSVTQVGGVPSGDENPGLVQWAVRRWVSDVNAVICIKGEFGELDSRGGGTLGRVFVDGVEMFNEAVAFGSTSYFVETTVSRGSTVDFAIDANGDGFFDVAEFTGIIFTLEVLPDPDPEPTCPADHDGDGVVDQLDMVTFMQSFHEGDADFDGDGDTDHMDLLGFMDAWVPANRTVDCGGSMPGNGNGRKDDNPGNANGRR